MQSSRRPGLHVALIMDGNGRWARERGLPRSAGHRAGAEAARAVIRAAPELGIATLTLFGFSAANWHRPASEVSALMSLFRKYLESETGPCAANGIRMSVIGKRERLSPRLLAAIEAAEAGTRAGRRLHLRLAVDYSAREAIVRAARIAGGSESGSRFEQALARAQHADSAPPVDLLLRTGGEQRLSDFLLWECAYAEFLFLKKMWPEFGARDLAAALAEFRTRDRRFGRVKTARAGAPKSTVQVLETEAAPY
ncbi:MAG: polyprenyl diphosphate synthase [Terriglobales bacterium]